MIPSRAVLKAGLVVSSVPGDSAVDPGGSSHQGGSTVSAWSEQGLYSHLLLLPAESPRGSVSTGQVSYQQRGYFNPGCAAQQALQRARNWGRYGGEDRYPDEAHILGRCCVKW